MEEEALGSVLHTPQTAPSFRLDVLNEETTLSYGILSLVCVKVAQIAYTISAHHQSSKLRLAAAQTVKAISVLHST